MTHIMLCLEFFKIGLFAVGGGLATLPFLHEISVNHPGWFTLGELSNMVAIANATPGPIGINMATYAGYTTAGFLGGVLSTLAITLPSYIVILIISGILEKYKTNKYVTGVFSGLRPAVVALILMALLQIARDVFINPNFKSYFDFINIKQAIFFITVFTATRFFKKDHTILLLLLGAIIGIIFKL